MNTTYSVEKGGILVIKVDLNGETKPSTSGNTQIIGQANHAPITGEHLPAKLKGKTVKFGLNVMVK